MRSCVVHRHLELNLVAVRNHSRDLLRRQNLLFEPLMFPDLVHRDPFLWIIHQHPRDDIRRHLRDSAVSVCSPEGLVVLFGDAAIPFILGIRGFEGRISRQQNEENHSH